MIASATASHAVDVAVLGAGPAGIGAAIAAPAAGRSVLLIDEAPVAGGQIYRKLPDPLLPTGHGAGDTDPDRRTGSPPRPRLRCALDSPRRARAGCCGCCGPACRSIFA